MAEPRTPTEHREWATLSEFEIVADGVMRRFERQAVGPDEWDFQPSEEGE